MTPALSDVAALSDETLLERLRELLARDAGLEAELLAHIGDVDARELYLSLGYPSLYAYLTEGLRLSESAAYHRIQAARAARVFPVILELVRMGRLHLSGVRVLVPVLTRENHRALLDRACHRSKRAIEELVRDLEPRADVRAAVRRLPERRAAAACVEASVPASEAPLPPRPAEARVVTARPRSHPEPLGTSRYKVQLTAGPETYAKLREAQSLLRHQIPDGNLAAIFDRALDALLRETRRAKFADHPRAERADSSPSSASRHIPASIKRAVVARDGERCTFLAADGRRCDSRDALEFHHVEPFARAMRHRADEITMRCRAHNRHAAIQDYGTEWMARFRRPRASATGPGASSDGAEEGRPDGR